jgi:hypothetical protein
MTKKEKLEKKLEKNLQEIFNDLVGSDLKYEEIINKILHWVIWDMRKNQGYNYEYIIKVFFNRLYADNQNQYIENEEYIVSKGNNFAETH